NRRGDGLAALASPAFIVALSALLANDFLLKGLFHDWFTGKLSDFTGLFVFASLWLTLLPGRPRAVLAGIALFFAWWKSPLSQAAIDLCHAQLHLGPHRVVDYSDLMALAVLPFAQLNLRRWRGRKPGRFVVYPIGIAAVVAVTATSMAPTYTSGDVHLAELQPGSITRLFADIDAITAEQGFVPASQYAPSDTSRIYKRPASDSEEAETLYVNYDPGSATLYYAYPDGPPKSEMETGRYETAFLQALSTKLPGLTVQSREVGRIMHMSGFYRITMTFPSHAGLFNTCGNSGSNNPDLQTSYAVLDGLARERGLTAGPPDPSDRTDGLAYCIKGDREYRGGPGDRRATRIL
ncbi:MAG TPA: hypothetical protein VGM16_03650, partial [Gammaproteobacteria bacterium]